MYDRQACEKPQALVCYMLHQSLLTQTLRISLRRTNFFDTFDEIVTFYDYTLAIGDFDIR